MSDRNVVVYFKPWRPVTERERELLDRVMREAAQSRLREWDRIDSLAAGEEKHR